MLPHAVDMLKTQGRMKFLRPVYRSLHRSKMGKQVRARVPACLPERAEGRGSGPSGSWLRGRQLQLQLQLRLGHLPRRRRWVACGSGPYGRAYGTCKACLQQSSVCAQWDNQQTQQTPQFRIPVRGPLLRCICPPPHTHTHTHTHALHLPPFMFWAQVALDTFQAAQHGYHPIARKMVAADLGVSI